MPPDGLQPGVAGACAKGNVAPPCIDTADAHITGASMSPDNKVLWLTFPEACKNPAPAPARQIISCIRLIELDTDASPIGAAKAAIKFDFDLAERNMDLYYPTLTFTGSRAQGTNNMIVSFGGSNTTVFPSLFASGQRGPVGLLLKPSLLPLVQLKSGGSPHLPLLGPPPVTRYGDYFGAAIDPTNSSISWMAGEYMQAPTIPPAVPFPLWSTVLSAVTSTPGNGTFSAGVKNITSPAGNIGGLPPPVPTNVTQSPGANNLTGQVCPDGNLPDVTTGLCADGSQPQAFNATVFSNHFS